ncbi:hypothetical protein C0989_003832 [Termitomyces sp. Mn162]|nr:hypothetical protein C0989_003832 [Termitomyces sp. Mn162]
MASEETLQSLAKAITNKPPFCTGTIPVTSEDCTLYYKQGLTSSWLDLTQPTDPQLEELAQACVPATFGRDQEDVLDESYRKAGKMDKSEFAVMFNVEKLGIDERVRKQLFDASDGDRVVKAELYKLNVYGKGSFFKSHKDTPRGGALVLRHSDQEWKFDSASLTREHQTPSIAYIAFYSDVDHEVTVVESGYRVTLTYNLFFESGKEASEALASVGPVAPDDHLLRDALSAALNDPTFFPKGGHLGFGLSFQYPISGEWTREAHRVRCELVNNLKGSDAMIYRVCKQASLATSLGAVYEIQNEWDDTVVPVLVPITRVLMNNQYNADDFIEQICGSTHKGLVIHELGKVAPGRNFGNFVEKYKRMVTLAWVTPLTTYSNFVSRFTAHGNESRSSWEYANLCITARVGPYGKRGTLRDRVASGTNHDQRK